MYYDWTYLLLIPCMLFALWAQLRVKSAFSKYSAVLSRSGLTGAEAARRILRANGIYDVQVTPTPGELTDHYDPNARIISLSTGVYGGASVAACAVAAHETGHAIQHATGYAPLKFRSLIVPAVSFCNKTVQWVLIIGLLLLSVTPSLLYVGIALFAFTTLFSFVTLPVEINASQRAVQWLERSGITDAVTTPMAKDALKWAAYTYVVAALGSLATLFYYIGLSRSR